VKRFLFEGVRLRVEPDAIVVESEDPLKILSSAPFNGGLVFSNRIVNLRVPREFYRNPQEYLKEKRRALGWGDAVYLMTGADLTKAGIVKRCLAGIRVAAVVTASVSNATSVTDGCAPPKVGTINTVVLVDRKLTDGCMVNAVATATEAKCKSLSSLDVRSQSSGEQATGTSSDAVVVASAGKGKALEYAGSATQLGWLVGKCVEEAVRKAIMSHDGLVPDRALLRRLEERGISLQDLISTAMELYVPNPNFSEEEGRRIFRRCLLEAMSDINVASLLVASLRLNEDGERGLIPGLNSRRFRADPVDLVADEIMGMSIAMYIAGYNGLFEFYRFDRKKPGILKRLPPVLDDVIGGLLAGASSRMYSEMLRRGSRWARRKG
jgi:alpha-ribazole phosphatase CobZ